MNPSLKLLLLCLLTIEITIIPNLIANLCLIVGSLILLIINHINYKKLCYFTIVPLSACISVFFTIYFYAPGHNLTYALTLISRIYAFALSGAYFATSTDNYTLVKSLEQNAHLPSKFAYGSLAAFNLLPKIYEEVKRIRIAGQMRGLFLSFWSTKLYFKAIISAMTWADSLSQGMASHGYREEKSRSVIISILVTKKDWLLFFSILLLFQPILFIFHI